MRPPIRLAIPEMFASYPGRETFINLGEGGIRLSEKACEVLTLTAAGHGIFICLKYQKRTISTVIAQLPESTPVLTRFDV